MTRAAAFTAEIVRSSSRGLAGMVVARFYETTEDAEELYGEGGFETWRKSVGARLQSLASAMEAGDPSIFADDLRWFRGMAAGRGIPEGHLSLALDALADTLRTQLPSGTRDDLGPFLEAAREAVAGAAPAAPEFATGSEAADLFELALLGDLGGARRFLVDGLRQGRFDVRAAVVDVVLPAAREAGRRWHLGQLGVAVEHVITATLRSALHSLTAALEAPPPCGKACFIAAVPGDAHDTGLVAFALLLESDGWRVTLAGADTPTEEIDAAAESYDCDLIALSATLASQRYALSSYLARRTSGIPVLVGGAAIRGADDAARLGAAGFAQDLVSGVDVARGLVGLT